MTAPPGTKGITQNHLDSASRRTASMNIQALNAAAMMINSLAMRSSYTQQALGCYPAMRLSCLPAVPWMVRRSGAHGPERQTQRSPRAGRSRAAGLPRTVDAARQKVSCFLGGPSSFLLGAAVGSQGWEPLLGARVGSRCWEPGLGAAVGSRCWEPLSGAAVGGRLSLPLFLASLLARRWGARLPTVEGRTLFGPPQRACSLGPYTSLLRWWCA